MESKDESLWLDILKTDSCESAHESASMSWGSTLGR